MTREHNSEQAWLLLSPCPADAGFGGVQRTAEIAWEGIRERAGLICYGTACGYAEEPAKDSRICCESKFGAAWRAATWGPSPALTLVWHVGLLKLAPFTASRNTRLVLFLHGIECWRAFSGLTERLLRRVDLFLINSRFTWERFVHFNPKLWEARHEVVPLGLGQSETEPPEPAKAPAALITGRLDAGEDYKGHRQLISAWRAVRKQVPGAELWIAGGGNQLDEIRQMGQSTEGVKVFGRVTEQRKDQLLRDCTCFAMPSRAEGFGLVYLEAMRFGRPCLVSNCDAGREVVNPPEAGLAVSPGDLDAMAGMVARLLTRGADWRVWSRQAKARYDSQFTRAAFQKRLAAALEREATRGR